MALTDTQIKKAKANDKLQKLSDGGGLQLHIAITGGKLWRLAYRFEGKQKTLSLGAYPAVGLADAREGRDKARKLLAAGTPSCTEKSRKACQASRIRALVRISGTVVVYTLGYV